MDSSPPFGEADLTNCERELIHLAGSIQRHGVLLSLDAATLRFAQASANTASILGHAAESLRGKPVAWLGGDLAAAVRTAMGSAEDEPRPLRCSVEVSGDLRSFEGAFHRVEDRWLVVELEPTAEEHTLVETVGLDGFVLREQLELAVQEVSAASTISALSEAVVRTFRNLTGYDRVMVYRFDPEGHGKIIGEARDPRLESLLGHHYPATDIPQRARRLYVKNRLRLLADVDYQPAALVPRNLAGAEAGELDMSMCYLRSMSPLHLQYLKNMGVTATLVVSLVRGRELWGLVACHHYAPRNLRLALRAGCEMLGEVIATRIAAIESYAYAHVAIQSQRLEQRLVEATSTDGDWRLALFRNPWTLLQPVDATGAALFYEGDVLTAGEVPSTPELRALREWIETREIEDMFHTASISHENPDLASLKPTASGVLAVKLSSSSPDYLMWFRKEQLRSVTWAGDPSKPVIASDPLTLSPRRSFAAWSELVRGRAMPWSSSEVALAHAFGAALVDIIGRVNAVRFLIANHQLAGIREGVVRAKGALLLVDTDGKALAASDAYRRLCGYSTAADFIAIPGPIADRLRDGDRHGNGWSGRFALSRPGGDVVPVAVRAEAVPDRDGNTLGYFLLLEDLTESERIDSARRDLEKSIESGLAPRHVDRVVSAVYANASLAAMDVVDGHIRLPAAGLLQELEVSTRRATDLYRRALVLGTES